MNSNFDFLEARWPDLALVGRSAELCRETDPKSCILKLALLGELVEGYVIACEQIEVPQGTDSSQWIQYLRQQKLLPSRVEEIMIALDKAGNEMILGAESSPEKAQTLLMLAYRLCGWFMAVYGEPGYVQPEYAPEDPAQCENLEDTLAELDEKITQLTIPTASELPEESQADRLVRSQAICDKLSFTEEELKLLTDRQVKLEISCLSVVNYALQQNRVPVLHNVTIANQSGKPLEHVELRIEAVPAMCVPLSRHIDFVSANSRFEVKDLKLMLDPDFLAGLTEKVTGLLRFVLVKDGTILYSQDQEMTALSFDEWHGYGFYPELISAFVTPNHPEVARINAQAASYLSQWTGDPSLDAYQTEDPNRVLAQAGAIYAALQAQGIVYAVPPASFERVGQRVRLCDAVMGQKMGTCLDLTLLYASCLEAAGLHPLLVIKQGHIFAGVWLEDLSFPESVQDDPALVTKRLASGVNELAVVECTAFAAGKSASFDEARAIAEKSLVGENPVEYIIDVNRARLSGVSPLPLRIHTQEGWHIDHPKQKEAGPALRPNAIGETIAVDMSAPAEILPKQMQWERKLLDLGLRNQLINMRLTKTTLPILTSSLDELENALSDGSDFSIHPRPADWHISANSIDFEMMHNLGGFEDVIKSEFKNRRLRSVYTEAEVSRVTKELYRTAKAALEENGANTLYLALGILRWYETAKSTKARYAPVVLVPVDIVRKSAAQGYVIRLRDDEPQMNITMLEKMKQDFRINVNGLDPLPQDEHGIDIRKVFTILRKAVMGQARWDVLESAYLGVFSFSQFVMWNDMRNRTEDLTKNKIVRSLMDGKLAWEISDMEIGSRVPEDKVFLPLSADASQLFAIEAACNGESFVLHGPPGTGKSQTITALIANALAQNKTVLFVAEKMAALEVVQKRLDNIGIGPFCLELHSNKSKKRDVLEQLRQATEVTKNTSAESYAAKAQQIAKLRTELDEYATALHTPRKCGMSLFELINGYEAVSDAPDIRPFGGKFAAGLTREQLDAQQTAVERMTAAAQAVGHPSGHPLSVVGCAQYSQRIKGELYQTVADYRTALENLDTAAWEFASATEQSGYSTYAQLEKLAAVAKELTAWNDLPRSWAAQENINYFAMNVQKMAQHYLNAEGYRKQLESSWNEGFFAQDGNTLLAEFNTTSSKWFLAKNMGLNNLAKRMAPYAKGLVRKESLGQQFTILASYQGEKAAGDAMFTQYGNLLDRWLGTQIDWRQIYAAADAARLSAQRLRDICGTDNLRVRFGGIGSLKEKLNAMNGAWTGLTQPRQAMQNLLGIVEPKAAGNWIRQQMDMCDNILANGDQLKEWISWNALAAEARNLGLGSVVDGYMAGMAHEDVVNAYRKAIYQSLAMQAIDSSPALNMFSGALFNEKIAQFKRLDQELTKLTRQEIYCRLASRVPNFAKEASHSSEVGILQRAIRSGGRGISIRKLFEQIPNLLPRLCPCMLMSPISAAQYLDPKREPFSMVVFDEASQLPTCKAVGALARGKEAVIVGDPKQMPPTAFFATNTVDEDNLEMEDLESILDDCLAMNIPQTHLLWHYRSRHESLIAFSNNRFYENKLYTFPSVNDRESKVKLVHVDGVFERGKNRQNRAEAEAVVEEIKRRSRDPEMAKYSVGVVTFNISQQNLIDDLLTEACAADPELEKWAFGSEEPVFIKNLENVQGDERDVILFSVGYGPDENGKVYMNFGPLNREGGWRRLNVAISRSRFEMVVFSTLTPDQINLSRTSAEGVAALKAFLEYAGGKELPQDESSVVTAKSCAGIGDTICRLLEEKGYQTDRAVGHSEYRIDIAVVDPENPDRYLLGILLDGPSYGASKTTRDRELAQISVLNGLGWKILRVWSMDWWDNSNKELDRILAELDRIRSDAPETEDTEVVEAEQPQTEEMLLASSQTPEAPVTRGAAGYSGAKLKASVITPDDFMLPRYTAGIRSKITAVIEKEAPISESLLTRKVVQSYGITRSGSRIQSRMEELYRSMGLRCTVQDGQRIFWKQEQNPDGYYQFRASGEGDNKREAKDVPMQEAVNAVRYVLNEQISLPQEELIREAARLMGYTRLGTVVGPLFASAIRQLQMAGEVTQDNNQRWILTENGAEKAVLCLK